MRIGVAKEIKPQEYRVALTPAGARELVQRGHEVLVESGAGAGSAFPDADYQANGARVTINGIGWGQTPVTVKNLPLGTKTVRLTSDGYASQQRTVELGSGGAYAVHMALNRQVKR